jgi:hypothetical protein
MPKAAVEDRCGVASPARREAQQCVSASTGVAETEGVSVSYDPLHNADTDTKYAARRCGLYLSSSL